MESGRMKRKLNYSEGTQRQMFGENMALHSRSTIPSPQLNLGVVSLWYADAFHPRALVSYRLSMVEWIVACTGILEKNLQKSATSFGHGLNFVLQHDNDPKHTTKLTKECFENNGISTLNWIHVRRLIWIQLRIYRILWRLKFMSGIHKISSN